MGTFTYPDQWTGRPDLKDMTERLLIRHAERNLSDLTKTECAALIPQVVSGSRLWAAVLPE